MTRVQKYERGFAVIIALNVFSTILGFYFSWDKEWWHFLLGGLVGWIFPFMGAVFPCYWLVRAVRQTEESEARRMAGKAATE